MDTNINFRIGNIPLIEAHASSDKIHSVDGSSTKIRSI